MLAPPKPPQPHPDPTRSLAVAVLFLFLAAPGVQAQTASARKAGLRAAPPASAPADLKGPVSPDKVQASKDQAGKPAPALPASLMSAAAPPPPPAARSDALQCRLSCTHRYYFCLAGADADSCPVTWSECVSACDDTLAPPAEPAGLLPPPGE